MTKIFATTQPDPVEKSPHDQKPTKTEGEVYTVIKPTILPISIPHAALVKKNRRCHFSWVIGLILLLWILATSAIVFHLAPECVYRKLHALTHVSEPRMPNSERFVFDIAEPDIKMAPKLAQLPPSSTVNDGTANDPLRKQAVIDNEVSEQLRKDVTVDGTVGEPPKKESIVEGTAGEELSDNNMVPDEDDATNAIRTLLRRPDVQQVVIVGRNEDSEAEHPQKGVVVIDGSAIGSNGAKPIDIMSQLQNNRGVIVPAEQLIGDSEKPINPTLLTMRPAESFDVTREHNMPMDRPIAPPQMPPSVSQDYQQEMAKYMFVLPERASAAESEMNNMMMEAAPPHRHHMLMLYRMPVQHMMFPPSQEPEPQESAEVPTQEGVPHEDNEVTQRPLQQFAIQMESQRQAMMPQQAVVQQLEQPHEIESPELPMIRPHDASADQIFAAMQADANVDRDAIFRRLLAQSQIENSRQEQQERAAEGNVQTRSETGDEVFWKMQQLTQDMNQQRRVEQTTVQTSGTEMPLLMIAQSFAHRSTVAEPMQKQERQPTSAATPFEEVKNDEHVSSPPKKDESYNTFFENEAVKVNSEFRPMIQDITALMPQSTTQATEEVLDIEETSGMELDQPEPAEGTSPFETEMNTPQSAVTQESPTITSSDEPIVLGVKDEQALLNSWNRDQAPVIEIPERPIVRVE
uniref:Transmembrane protein n=1 Tax=Ascaris lumbricoides TaxID=6252 RepID=A0A9J2P337_ASCLU